MANEQRVVELIVDATGVEAGGRRAEAAYSHLGERAAAATERAKAAFQTQTQILSQNLPTAIDRTGAAYDRLRAKSDPVLAMQLKFEAEMTRSLGVINRAILLGVTTEERANAEIAKLRQQQIAQLNALREAHDHVGDAQMRAANQNNRGAAQASATNVAYQAQDTVVQAVSGAPVGMIAMQQGPQLAMAMAQAGEGGGIKALASGLSSLLSMQMLLSIGFVAAGAAAIQYFTSAGKETKTLEKLLDEQVAAIKRIRDVWGEAATARSQYGRESSGSASFGLETNISEMTKKLREANARTTFGPGAVASSVTDAINKNISTTGMSGLQFRETTLFKALKVDFQELQKATIAGKPDVLGLVSSLEDIGRSSNNAGIKAITQDAVAALQPFKNLAQALRDAEFERRRLFDTVGPNGMALSQGRIAQADDNQYGLYQSQQTVALQRSRQAFDAQVANTNARSPAERAAAARAAASAQYNNDESVPLRNQRIDQAASLAQTQAQYALDEAQKERKRSLDATIASQQVELVTIGKTGGEVAALRMQYQLTAQIEAEASKNNIKVNQQELDLIKQKSAEYGRMADQIARAKLSDDLSFQQDQFNRNPDQRVIANELKSRGLPVDMLSKAAREISAANDRVTNQTKQWTDEAFNAQISGISAKSPAERAAAARASAAAQHNPTEPDTLRSQRIDQAGAMAQAQAQYALDEAQKERKRSLDATLAGQQLELIVIGKTGGAVAALRMQYQLTAQVQAEAAKNNVSVSQQELDLIKQKSAEYGRMADQIAKANLRNDLQFERDQLYRNPTDQQIASRQRGAGLPVDLNSTDAKFMRETSRIDEVRTGIKGFFTDFSQQLVSNGGKTGDALGTAIKNAAINALQKIGDAAFGKITNFLTDALLGTGKSASTSSAATGVAGLGAATVGRLVSPASIASQAIPALSSAGVTKTGIDLARITSATGLGADVNSKYAQQFQGFIKDLEGTGYKINSLGGYNYRNIAGTNKLSNHALGNAIDINPQQNPMGKNLVTDLPSNVGELAAKNGLSWGGAWNSKKDAMHFEVPSSAAALDKLASSAGNATKGLGTFGTGIGQLGQQLGGAAGGLFPSAPSASGGGGLFGLFGGLFKSSPSAILAGSAQARAAVSSGIGGLFDRGGYTGPGGVNDPAGIVHRGEVVWSQRDVARAGGVAVVDGMRLGRRGYANGGPVDVPAIRSAPANSNSGGSGVAKVDVGVTFDEDNGFRAYVKKTSQEQASQISQQGLADLSDRQRRGGFLQMQQRATAQRG
jgi:hypothetical protein